MNFIGTTFIRNAPLLSSLINFFEEHPRKEVGRVICSEGSKSEVYPDFKRSTEVLVTPDHFASEPIRSYCQELQKSVDSYIQDFPWCNQAAPWGMNEGLKVQKYLPGEGYYSLHHERVSAGYPNCSRHLVFMTYLNTVSDGGGTFFLHQDLSVNAEEGKTLIWPADWTHTHKGIVSPSETKYIVTGWFNFAR